MTAVDVDALDKLREAAKPGPWRVAANGEDVVSPTQGVVADAYNTADAALIVAAVNALPDLIAEVRRGRALREAVEGLAEAIKRGRHPGAAADLAVWVTDRLRAALAAVDGGEQ